MFSTLCSIQEYGTADGELMTTLQTSQVDLATVPTSLSMRMLPRRSRAARFFQKHWVMVFPTAVIVAVVLAGMFAPELAPHDPLKISLANRLKPPFWLSGDMTYALGADALGRDILSRILFGARVSLLIGFVSVFLSGSIGVLLGLIAGYYGGWIDDLIMRISDVQLAFPVILLAIAIIAVLGPGLINIIIVLAITGWVTYARMVRGDTLGLREREFIEAARVIGQRDWVIILRHILPNVMAPLIIVATFAIPSMILTEAGLSFLGLGVESTTPSWGNMLAEGKDYMDQAWWLTALPGVVLTLTVLSINIVGDWLRDVLDPRLKN